MYNEGYRLSKSEVISKKLLGLKEAIAALRFMGIDGISVHLVRKYQSRRLIRNPRIGPAKATGARYQGYFDSKDILAIAEIRLRLDDGETLEEIGFEAGSLFGNRITLFNLERNILRKNLAALPLFNTLRTEMIVDAEAMQQIIDLAKIIKKYQKEKDRVELKTLGNNLDSQYSEKLIEFLKDKFENT